MDMNYSIGLDIGVASVGWSCITKDLNIPKYNGRYAIGVREFDAAETAENRRMFRSTRRRYNRRIKRIQLLQQLINPLFQNDPGFFIQTDEKEKHFWRNSNKFEKNSLTETLKYLDKNPNEFPTIYHLRYALLNNNKQYHPRLIYLALHHLVKYRGHFLNEGMIWGRTEKGNSAENMVDKFIDSLKLYGYETVMKESINTMIVEILENKELANSDKRMMILKEIGREYNEPISLLLGLKVNLGKLFFASDNKEIYDEEKLKLSLLSDDLDDVYEKLLEDEKLLIDQANVIYQSILLKDLLGDSFSVAEAKVKSYKKFGEDLNLLKEIFNDFLSDSEYRQMFITSRKNKTEYQNTRNIKLLCTFDRFLLFNSEEKNFYKELFTIFKGLQTSNQIEGMRLEQIKNILDKLEQGNFLQKQRNQLNAAIPHQNNLYEAEKILRMQQKYYPEITDAIIERVKQVISYRIPYYIGPLVKDNTDAEFGWVVRNNETNVTPWTINEVINHSTSAENFINRMTSFCAYLLNEKVLPKQSLTYEKFEVLNELNGIQIRSSYEVPGKEFRLDKHLKQWIIENVFLKYKTVTHTILKREIKRSPYKDIIYDTNTREEKEIFGTQKEDRFSTSLSTHIDMRDIFDEVSEKNYEMLEQIVYWITVFEEKKILKMKMQERYRFLSNEQIKRLSNLNYKGWGRLSRRLLDELPVQPNDYKTIMDVMNENAMVFMEVLATDTYQLDERIAKLNQVTNDEYTKIKYEDIKDLQGSPALKKGIWQAIQIIEELTDIFGEPQNIMIEFSRQDDKKERTKSRKKQIEYLQQAINVEEKEFKEFLRMHSRYDEAKYHDNRLFLYITQQGKCLYSGEPLNIARLQDYEIDHILPRSFVKDNSIDNLALVKFEMNQKKGNTKMPLEIIKSSEKAKQRMYWKRLYENKLISNRKYHRLLKNTFSDQDKESFFARQLVETRQITKHVKNLLDERFENTVIHSVNANLISKLRAHTNTYKIRGMNNKHHAVDAALTALIIQLYFASEK